MTPLQKCNSCGGTYHPDQPGGYYHACAPVTVDGKTWTERPDKRDENLVVTGAEKKDGLIVSTVKVKSEGKGASTV